MPVEHEIEIWGLEDEARRKAGYRAWSDDIGLLPAVISELSKSRYEPIRERVLIESLAKQDPEFGAWEVRFALRFLCDSNVVERTSEQIKDYLRPTQWLYALTLSWSAVIR